MVKFWILNIFPPIYYTILFLNLFSLHKKKKYTKMNWLERISNQREHVDETAIKTKVEKIIGMDFSYFSNETNWSLNEVYEILESLQNAGIRDLKCLFSMSFIALDKLISHLDINLQRQTILLQASILNKPKCISPVDSSHSISPAPSPNEDLKKQKGMKKQDDWNQAALNRVASTQIQSTGSCSW